MPLSLGEKLRQAREERGISISEVAEQTRISSLYLESIENNDYKPLPGGIFNKGFVRSYARYIGFNEQEALRDYSEIVATAEAAGEPENRVYRPEVLTDDRAAKSLGPSIVFAVIILALMTGGLIFLVRFLTNQNEPVSPNLNNANTAANTNTSTNTPVVPAPAPAVSDMFVVEIKAIGEPVWISYTLDGSIKEKTLEAEESMRLDVRDALKISYAKVKANKLQVTANGRRIDVPVEGLEITRANLSQLIQGSASTPQPVVRSTPAPSTPRPTPRPAQSPRPRPSLAPTIIRPTRSPEQ